MLVFGYPGVLSVFVVSWPCGLPIHPLEYLRIMSETQVRGDKRFLVGLSRGVRLLREVQGGVELVLTGTGPLSWTVFILQQHAANRRNLQTHPLVLKECIRFEPTVEKRFQSALSPPAGAFVLSLRFQARRKSTRDKRNYTLCR